MAKHTRVTLEIGPKGKRMVAVASDWPGLEQYPGTGSTDFWGISFAFSSIDKQGMSGDELERELTLMQACWAFFDEVRRRVSVEMQKGERGGGRDRDHIVRRTLYTEQA